MRIDKALILLIFSFVIMSGNARAQRCLPYEPKTVTLKGLVFAKDFPGPPNYESFRGGDKRMRYWILRLAKPVCVEGAPDQINVHEDNIREIQLVFKDGSFYKKYRSLVKRRNKFRIVGTLCHQISGYHVRKILVTVQSIVPVRN